MRTCPSNGVALRRRKGGTWRIIENPKGAGKKVKEKHRIDAVPYGERVRALARLTGRVPAAGKTKKTMLRARGLG